MSLKNCLPCLPRVAFPDAARLNALDQRRHYGQLRCATVQTSRIDPGSPAELLRVEGQGALRTFFMELSAEAPEAVSRSRIAVYVDGEAVPALAGDLADFFLSGEEGQLTHGDYAGKTLDEEEGKTTAFYRYLFVPFHRSCAVRLEGRHGPLRHILSQIYYSTEPPGGPADYGHYNKAFSVEKKGQCGTEGQPVELARLRGRGVFHSFQLSLKNPDSAGHYMEGNVEIYLDGEDFPSYQTSGTEEFFMGGVYFASLHESSYSGCTRTFNDGSRNPQNLVSAHRLFIDDPITFHRELRIVWHNGEPGQGPGEYRGITDYAFHGIYYLDFAAAAPVPPLPPAADLLVADLARRLHALDRNAARGAFSSLNLDRSVRAQELTRIGAVTGRGAIGAVYLEGVPEDGPCQLVLEADGRTVTQIELPLFFFNAPFNRPAASPPAPPDAGPPGGAANPDRRYVGREGGSPAPGTFFRYVDVPFQRQFSLALRASAPGRIRGRLEYRSGRCGGGELTGQSRRQTLGQDEELVLDFTGRGELEEVVFLADGKAIDGEIHVQVDGNPRSAVFSPTLQSFFLSGKGPSAAGSLPPAEATGAWPTTGAGAFRGVLQNGGGRFLAFRLFRQDPIPFSRRIRLVYFHRRREPVTATMVAAVRAREPALYHPPDPAQPDLPELQVRLNQLDGAYHLRYLKCYTSMEQNRGALEPGQTGILWEDYGPGAVRLIRLGTPACGPALLAARLRVFLDGDKNPAIDTTVERFFSARMEDPIYWYNTRYLSRPSKIYRQERSSHLSCFRYLLLPYRKGIRITLTAPETGGIWGFNQVYYQGGTSTQVPFGRQEHWKDLAFAGTVSPQTRILAAAIRGTGRIESWQVILENPESPAYLEGKVELFVDERRRPAVDCALARFFMSCPEMRAYQSYLTGYTAFWQQKHREEQGHFTSACVGWPRRSTRAPYRTTVYRLFGNDPLVFTRSLQVYWTNAATTATTVYSDLIVSGIKAWYRQAKRN